MRRRYGDGVSTGDRWTLLAAAAVGALLGSKLLFLLEDPLQTAIVIKNPLLIAQGKTIIGALLFGTMAVEIVKRFSGIHIRTGDLFAVPLCLGIAVGRVGCFLTGLTDNTLRHSQPTLPWGVNFWDSIRRHPTQLYEVIFVLLLGAFRRPAAAYRISKATFFVASWLGYMSFRVLVGFSEAPYPHVLGMAVIQWAALAGVLMYTLDLKRWLTTSRSQPLIQPSSVELPVSLHG